MRTFDELFPFRPGMDDTVEGSRVRAAQLQGWDAHTTEEGEMSKGFEDVFGKRDEASDLSVWLDRKAGWDAHAAEMNKQSLCGVEGHTMATWVKGVICDPASTHNHPQSSCLTDDPRFGAHCSHCSEIASAVAAERERCAKALIVWAGQTDDQREPEEVIRSLGPTNALQEARLDAVINELREVRIWLITGGDRMGIDERLNFYQTQKERLDALRGKEK